MKRKDLSDPQNNRIVSKKVHVVFNVNEKERIIDPILNEKPNILYYFHYQGDIPDINPETLKHNINVIKNALPSCIIIEDGVNYTDYYQIIGKIYQIKKKEATDENVEITINLGTGSKMIAIAVMDAQRLWGNLNLIYPYSEDYDPKRSEGAHKGMMNQAPLPNFKFQTPDVRLIQSLQILQWEITNNPTYRMHKHYPLKDFVLDITEKYGLIQVSKNPNKRNMDSSQRQRVKEGIIKPLIEKWKLLEKEDTGKRSAFLKFSKDGENFIKVFIHCDYGIKYIPPIKPHN